MIAASMPLTDDYVKQRRQVEGASAGNLSASATLYACVIRACLTNQTGPNITVALT